MELDQELIKKFSKLNEYLSIEYKELNNPETIKDKINQLGKIEQIKSVNSDNTILMGVDGSYNCYGANYPHQVWVFRALAKSTNSKEVFNHHILTPLDLTFRDKLDLFSKDKRLSSFDAASLIIKQKLAEIELDVAIEGLTKCNPSMIFMDGSLLRYKIECGEKWEYFKEEVIKNNVLLAGVIEEIGTKNLGKYLGNNLYDREILFGLLDKGERLIFYNQIREDFITTYIRPGEDPQPIAMDFLVEQKSDIEKGVFVATELTPQKGRGIPIWIDIIDSEVRITNKIVEELAQTYISPDLRYKLFSGKRKERWY